MSKVLVDDDSAVMRKIIKKNIKEAGLVVDEFADAGDGKQALDVVSHDNIDLILCYWNMPNMSGLEFIKTLRSLNLPKKIPVVMVTTEGLDSKKAEAKESGADGYLIKPFTPEQLRNALGSYILVN